MTKMFSLSLLTCVCSLALAAVITLADGCSLAVDVDRRQIPDVLYNIPDASPSEDPDEEEAGMSEDAAAAEDAGALEEAGIDGDATVALPPLMSLDAGLDAAL